MLKKLIHNILLFLKGGMPQVKVGQLNDSWNTSTQEPQESLPSPSPQSKKRKSGTGNATSKSFLKQEKSRSGTDHGTTEQESSLSWVSAQLTKPSSSSKKRPSLKKSGSKEELKSSSSGTPSAKKSKPVASKNVKRTRSSKANSAK